jgi:hypothetical protein
MDVRGSGLCHEIFLKVLKIKSAFSVYALMFFKLFCCLVMEKLEDKVLAYSMKKLSHCENPSSNPLQNAFCGIQEAACDSVNYFVNHR